MSRARRGHSASEMAITLALVARKGDGLYIHNSIRDDFMFARVLNIVYLSLIGPDDLALA